MAVVSVTESAERDAVRGQVGRRLYRRSFVVVTNNVYTEQSEILSDMRLPQPYTLYPTDPGAACRSVNAVQDESSRYVWRVTVEYDSEYEIRDNPFSEPPDIRADTEMYEEAVYARSDASYDPAASPGESLNVPYNQPRAKTVAIGLIPGDFCTSAGEPFNPPITIQKSRPIVVFTRNQASFEMAFKVHYENTINLSLWCGLPQRVAWLRSIKAVNHVQKSTTLGVPDIYYARVEYTFALKAETWDLQIPDIGSWYLDYSSGSAVRKQFLVEGTGHPRLGRLDHSVAAQPGKRLAAGQDVQFLRFGDLRRVVDFKPLSIDLNLSFKLRRAVPRGR